MRSEPIKVCRIIARLNIGGPAIHTILLAAGLDPARFASRLIAGQEGAHEGSLRDLAAAKGVTPVLVPELGREVNGWRDVRAVVRLVALLRQLRPTIVHTHTAKAGTLGRLAAWWVGVPVRVHTFHGHVFHGYFGLAKSRLFLAIERVLARLTTRILVVSPRQRDEILGLGIGQPDQVRVVPLGLELDPFLAAGERRGELRSELGFPADAPLVGTVARLVPIKGIPVFLAMARRLADRYPAARFLVVGDGERRAELEAEARALGLGDRVRFLGWRRDLARIYADLDVVVLSSWNEGTPVSLIEAMAAGRPVAATAVGGVPDLVRDGETGLLVPAGDAAGLAAAVDSLLGDPAKAATLGSAGRAAVVPKHSATALVARMEAVYDELLGLRTGQASAAGAEADR